MKAARASPGAATASDAGAGDSGYYDAATDAAPVDAGPLPDAGSIGAIDCTTVMSGLTDEGRAAFVTCMTESGTCSLANCLEQLF